MSFQLITPPEGYPLTLEEVKLHLRVDHAVDDELIGALIGAATEAAQAKTGRALLPQTWMYGLPCFPHAGGRYNDYIELPKAPLIGVVSVAYTDPDGQVMTMDPSDYTVEQGELLARLRSTYWTTWPVSRLCEDAVRITYQAGYANADAVPSAIKAWMKIHIATLYENRSALSSIEQSSTPRTYVDGLLDGFKVAVM